MHAFLIIGNTRQSCEKEIASRVSNWKISSWDVTRIPEEGTVGIEAIRDFTRNLSLAPRNSPAKAGILTDMERLTVEAQNALLKTIEEPPPHTYILGTTSNPEALLPTVRSRMTVVITRTVSSIDPSVQKLLQKLLDHSPGKRLQFIEPYVTTRDDAKKFVATIIAAAREELLARPTPKLTNLIRSLLAAQSQLSVNVNQKLVVDNAFLPL